MKTFLLSILILSSLVFYTNAQTVNILSVEQLDINILGITLELDADVSLNPFSVDVNVLLEDNGILSSASATRANFEGHPGEQVTVPVNTNVDLDQGDIQLDVQLGNLLSLDLDIDLDLGDNLVGNLVDGVFNLLDGLLGGLLDGLFSSIDALLDISNVVVIDGSIHLDVTLLDSISGGLSTTLNIEALTSDGQTVQIGSQDLIFSGNSGETIEVVIDIEANIAGLDISIDVASIQVSLGNIEIDLGLQLGVNLDGLDDLLHSVFDIIDDIVSGVSSSVADLEVSGVELIDSQLNVDVALNVEVGSILSAQVNVLVFSDVDGELLSAQEVVSFSGVADTVESLVFDLSGIDLTADIFILVELGDLQVDLSVNLDLGDAQLFELVNGVLNSILDPILSSLDGSLATSASVTIDSVSIVDGKIMVSLQLDADVASSFDLNVNVHLVSLLGIPILSVNADVSFEGHAGELQTVAITQLPLIASLTLDVNLSDLVISADVLIDISDVLSIQLGALL